MTLPGWGTCFTESPVWSPAITGNDRAELVAAGYRDLLPLPFLVALAAPDQDPQPVGDLGEIGDLERAELAPAERPGKAQAEQRAVPLADHGVGAERDHLADQVRGRRRLALFGRPDGATDPPQDCPDALAAGRWLVPGHLVVVADRGGAATDRAGLAAAISKRGQVGRYYADVRWQGCGAPGGAPGGEVAGQSLAYAARVASAFSASAYAIVASISAVVSAPGSARSRGIRSCKAGLQWVWEEMLSDLQTMRLTYPSVILKHELAD